MSKLEDLWEDTIHTPPSLAETDDLDDFKKEIVEIVKTLYVQAEESPIGTTKGTFFKLLEEL